jgi:hypothetical protein
MADDVEIEAYVGDPIEEGEDPLSFEKVKEEPHPPEMTLQVIANSERDTFDRLSRFPNGTLPFNPSSASSSSMVQFNTHDDENCNVVACRVCAPSLGVYSNVKKMFSEPAVSYATTFKRFVERVEAYHAPLVELKYTKLGEVFSLSKLSLAYIFDAFVDEADANFTIIDQIALTLNNSLFTYFHDKFSDKMTEANKKIKEIHAVPNPCITTVVLESVFPFSFRKNTSVSAIRFIDGFSNDHSYVGVFIKAVKEMLVRCVERGKVFIGNIILRVLEAILELMTALTPCYLARVAQTFSLLPDTHTFIGLTSDMFARSYITAQLFSQTQMLFTFLFRHNVDHLCVTETLCVIGKSDAIDALQDSVRDGTAFAEKKRNGFFSLFSSSS